MSMVVQHNMQSMNANRMLNITTGQQAKSTEKLSSGYRINRAADDAAGLSISEKMRKQIKGLDRATSNAQDGVSAVQTAEGALTEVHSMLQRMNELATQASNGTNSEDDRQSIQNEIAQLTTEIDRVAETTKFNETYLLKGEKTTYQKTLAGHDAGIKGTFVDSSDKATLTVDLSVGKNVSIAGQNYNIAKYDGTSSNNYQDSSDSLSKLQDDIKNIATDKATVTLDSTTYTYDAASKTFDAGTGTTYSAEELAGKLKDGTKISMDANADGTKEADGVIVRDYTDKQTNIKASDAADKMVQALTQANNIGATSKTATVTASTGVDEVKTLANGGTIKTSATQALLAYNKTTKEFETIAADTDFTELAKSGDYEFYKELADGDGGTKTFAVDANKFYDKDLVVLHKDAVHSGVSKELTAGTDVTSATGAITETGGTATVQAGYVVYEKADLVADAEYGADTTHKASGTLADVNGFSFSIDFEDITDPAVATDEETGKKIAEGQNALLAATTGIKFTATAANATTGVFSHNFGTGSKLDIDENGVVSYDGTKIATITATGKATAAGSNALATVTNDKNAVYTTVEADSNTYTFTIDKGQTEVPDDLTLNLHVGADADMTNKISVGIASMDSKGLGISGINVADDSGVAATYAIDAIEDAIKTVSSQRSALGAVQNRLEHTIANLDNVVENTTSAESAIRDTDMASEMVNFSKNNILAQAGQSMLAQANQSNQGVLSLLG